MTPHPSESIAVAPTVPLDLEAEGSERERELAAEREQLERTWRDESGLWGWLATTNHKSIGRRYLVTTFAFFVLAGILALLMRIQLARPENTFLNPDLYNQVFSTHGTTMMFLFAVPVMQALGIYFVPLMVGTRNVAFPRLNAFGYWTYLIGGVLLYVGLLSNTGPDTGWFSYVPLSGPAYSPGKRVDVWAQMITFTEIAALVSSLELIVTILKCRAPGMTLNRLPIFVWAQLVTSFIVLFAMTTVATASMFLASDRLVGTHFFNPAEGGDPLLWQHLFWYFGHPEVYIIFIPALGVISSMIATFTRRPIFGYTAVVVAMIGTGFLSFGLWVHHMFATPLPQVGKSFFTAGSALISVFTGAQIFCWIATIRLGRPRFTTAFLFVLSFFLLFTIGGVTGVMIGSVPFDLQAHDTYFIVAHLHFVLIGGAVAPLLGAVYYWFPKVTGRLLSEAMGKAQVALFVTGVLVTFFPMHYLGLWGMPRRVYTYLESSGWATLNLLQTIGAFAIAASVLLMIVNVVRSLARGAPAGDDPWGAETLEWATHTPPPPNNIHHIPVVTSRSELWGRPPVPPVVVGLDPHVRSVLLTSPLDAEPESRHEHPDDSIWPLVAALGVGVLFVTLIFTEWGLVVGTLLLIPAFVRWAWPPKRWEHQLKTVELKNPARVEVKRP